VPPRRRALADEIEDGLPLGRAGVLAGGGGDAAVVAVVTAVGRVRRAVRRRGAADRQDGDAERGADGASAHWAPPFTKPAISTRALEGAAIAVAAPVRASTAKGTGRRPATMCRPAAQTPSGETACTTSTPGPRRASPPRPSPPWRTPPPGQ